jgi:hypothetical protein
MVGMERPRIQFGIRTLLEIIAVAAFVLALIYGRTGSGGAGRYQMQVHKPVHGDEEIYVLDSQTGKLWHRIADPSRRGSQWVEYGTPLPEN